MEAIPAVSISRNRSQRSRDGLSPKWNDLGFRINPRWGSVEGVPEGADPEDYRSDPSAERISGVLPGEYRIDGAWLVTEGVTVAGASYGLLADVVLRTPRSVRAGGYMRIGGEFMFGAFYEGHVAANFADDGQLSLAPRGDAFLTWRWPLERIDLITLSTHKVGFKWVNVTLQVLSSTADGSDAESLLGAQSVRADKQAAATSGGRGMQDFAQFLAARVAARRGTHVRRDTKDGPSDRAIGWSVTRDGFPAYWTSVSAEEWAG
jgi:hypothetical protein